MQIVITVSQFSILSFIRLAKLPQFSVVNLLVIKQQVIGTCSWSLITPFDFSSVGMTTRASILSTIVATFTFICLSRLTANDKLQTDSPRRFPSRWFSQDWDRRQDWMPLVLVSVAAISSKICVCKLWQGEVLFSRKWRTFNEPQHKTHDDKDAVNPRLVSRKVYEENQDFLAKYPELNDHVLAKCLTQHIGKYRFLWQLRGLLWIEVESLRPLNTAKYFH